jgi:hypothetical protein
MAEATDRPQTSEQVPPDAVMPGEQLPAVPPAAPETYQPLSLLAMAGFAIAIIYTLVVLIGGAVALFGRIPWLMPYWTFLLPLAAWIVCWAARTRIRDSEGTLSGIGFTTWGSRLAIVLGLTYAAYYSFTFLAVRFQAVAWTDNFFEQLKKGELEQAYLTSMGVPTKGIERSELRNEVESRFNTPKGKPGTVGAFTRFREDSSVRFIEMAGETANITPRGVEEWEFKSGGNGGYRVVLNYHVATPLTEFDVKIETFGRDPKPGERGGRQWQINLANGILSVSENRMTPEGTAFVVKSLMAQAFVTDWILKLDESRWKDTYLLTLEPSERERLGKEPKLKVDPLAELSKLIRIDEKTFWAGKREREEILNRVRKTFQLGADGNRTFSLSLQQQSVPFVRQIEGKRTAYFDVSLYYLDEASRGMAYMVDGRLMVSANDSDADRSSSWRVEALDIDTGRNPPMPTMRRATPPALPEQDPLGRQ